MYQNEKQASYSHNCRRIKGNTLPTNENLLAPFQENLVPHRRWDWAETRQVLFVSETGVTGCLLRKQHPVKRMWTVTSWKETDGFWSSRRSSGGETRIDSFLHKTSRYQGLYRNPSKSRHGFSKGVLYTVLNYLGSFLRAYCLSLMQTLNLGPKGINSLLGDFFFPPLSFFTAGRARCRRHSPAYKPLIITHFETAFQHLWTQAPV